MTPLAAAPLAGARTLLFAPAASERHLRSARASAADAVIADLEDAVAPAARPVARELLRVVLGEGPRERGAQLVRVNALDTPDAALDLAALAGLPLDGVVVPKACAAVLPRLADLAPLPVVALVETAQGLRDAHAVACHPAVVAVMLGTVDLATELGLEPGADEPELLFARSQLVRDAVAAGLPGPIDGVHLDVGDEDGLRAATERARRLGFAAKGCVHPRQVAIVNELLGVSQERAAWARRVLEAQREAAARGEGVFLLDGRMVDRPVVQQAERLLAAAKAQR